MDLIWAVLGLSWDPVGQSRASLGILLGRLGALVAVWRVSWCRRGAVLGRRGAF